MNFINNIKSFLYDENYFISIYDDKVHIYSFEKILKFSKNELIFKFSNFNITLKGEKLIINKMLKNEVLISGIIKSLNVIYE